MEPIKDTADIAMTLPEAMEYLHIGSRSTFYKLMRQGKIPAINLNPGGKYTIRRFKKSVLDAYLSGDKIVEAKAPSIFLSQKDEDFDK